MEKLKGKTRKANVKSTDSKARAYYFAIEIIKFIEKNKQLKISSVVKNQLIKSSTSIGANLIEAKAASSKRDFIKFYNIALKSANETKFWLGVIRDGYKSDRKSTNDLLHEVKEISNMIAASLLTLRNKR